MKPRIITNRFGALWMWAPPVPTRKYAIGADTAAGIRGGDPCTAEVIDIETAEQCAEWYGWEPPHQFGITLALLGTFYNQAELGIETHPSPHGLAVYDAALAAGYQNLFAQRVWESRENRYVTRKGWSTSEQSKGVLMARIAEALSDNVPIHSERLLNEMLNAQLDDRERIDRKCRNDLIMAYGISLKIADQSRATRREEPKAPERLDFEERWWKDFEKRAEQGNPLRQGQHAPNYEI